MDSSSSNRTPLPKAGELDVRKAHMTLSGALTPDNEGQHASRPDRKLTANDFTQTTDYMNGIKVVRDYLILTDGSLQIHEEHHYNEWDVCFYFKHWHFDGSPSSINIYNPYAKSWRETQEILLYSYNKSEGSTVEDIYKFDKLKGRCFQYENAILTRSWEPALWLQ
jgi:hypothetical protein